MPVDEGLQYQELSSNNDKDAVGRGLSIGAVILVHNLLEGKALQIIEKLVKRGL